MGYKLNKVLSQRVGKITTWKKEIAGIVGETSAHKFRIQFYSESIARITITKENEFEDFSYAVIAEPSDTKVDISETTDRLTARTSKFQLDIKKDSFHTSFSDLKGNVINEDDTFATSWNGEQVTTYKKLQEGERFIGLGEKTGSLDRRGHGYTNWNTDNFGYGSGADPLYSSVPFYIGLHHSLVYGIFFDNTHKTFFNFGASNDRFASFAADSGEMNYYFIYGESVAEIIAQYTHLTGRMEMPPLWSIGYQQCRYSYYPDKEVMSIANTFREKDIPADAIVFDIHYMESY